MQNKIEIRKVMKIGKSSLGIGLPKKFLTALGIDHKDILTVEKTEKGLFVTKYIDRREV
jgi:antitoxin component of MazEF toxin-antitoxin module